MLHLLTEHEVARQLNVSVASMRRWRIERRGPHFIKVGSLVRYRQEDLESWLTTLPTGGDQIMAATVEAARSNGSRRTLRAAT